jgi:hypothetical protein
MTESRWKLLTLITVFTLSGAGETRFLNCFVSCVPQFLIMSAYGFKLQHERIKVSLAPTSSLSHTHTRTHAHTHTAAY